MRRSLVGAVALAGLPFAACDSPPSSPLDALDGGSVATGRLAVHTETTSLPALIADVSLSLATLEVGSDREPGSAARTSLSAPLALGAATPTSIANAPPATYGAVRFVAIDALTVTTTTGHTIRIEFGETPPIELRCAGAGRYLAIGEEVDLFVALDFASIQTELSLSGFYPPTAPLSTVTDPTLVAILFDAFADDLSIDCAP